MYPSPNQQLSLADEARRPTRGGRWLFGSGVAVVLLVAMYFTGLLHRGYESKRIAFSGISRIESGRGFGARTMHLRQGQTLVVHYHADIKHGGLRVWLKKRFAPLADVPEGSGTIDRSGSGQLRFPIGESALYDITIRGTPDRNGYDLSYTLSWGVE